jgi:hypothetical protein
VHTHIVPRYVGDAAPGRPLPFPEPRLSAQPEEPYRSDVEALRTLLRAPADATTGYLERGRLEPRASPLELVFRPESDAPQLAEAAAEYTFLWIEWGVWIATELTRATGLSFPYTRLEATVCEEPSRSHPLRLRASYDRETKLGTLVHELAHRLVGDRAERSARTLGELESHELIDLFLFDVWADLFGEKFARQQVEVESQRRPIYAEAWTSALAIDRRTRAERLSAQLAQV